MTDIIYSIDINSKESFGVFWSETHTTLIYITDDKLNVYNSNNSFKSPYFSIKNPMVIPFFPYSFVCMVLPINPIFSCNYSGVFNFLTG